MNDFAPRIEMMTTDRITPARAATAVAAVQPPSSPAGSAGGADIDSDGGEQARREHMASASDYARVQARIADILADVDAAKPDPMQARSTAADRLEALRQPMIVIPMPPASVEVIERAVEIARSMVEKAALTRAAHGNVHAGTVDSLLAMPG